MNTIDKVRQLSLLIQDRIIPLIDHDYVLYGLPYYSNIGDTLIWEGELELLKRVPFKCRGVCAWNDYPSYNKAKDNIILITGGGYFGDVWRKGWDYMLNGIKHCKNNKIILLPNSIYYESAMNRDHDSAFLSEFKNLTICARDRRSYEYAKQYFQNDVLLVPDMAFCMSINYIKQWENPPFKQVLLLKRNDKELVSDYITLPDNDYETHDWPTIESSKFTAIFSDLIHLINRFRRKIPQLEPLWGRIYNGLYYTQYRKKMTCAGVSFISSYNRIYTTRLHGLILAILLGKEVFFIDNTYGKLSVFYETWLYDTDGVYQLQ